MLIVDYASEVLTINVEDESAGMHVRSLRENLRLAHVNSLCSYLSCHLNPDPLATLSARYKEIIKVAELSPSYVVLILLS
jgi:hypothetical protein